MILAEIAGFGTHKKRDQAIPRKMKFGRESPPPPLYLIFPGPIEITFGIA